MMIYKITNRLNGKVYIGQTIRSLSKRWREHCCKSSGCLALHNAIIKYGAINFTVEQIDIACSREELDQKEIYWIEFYKSFGENGYNLTSGGESQKAISEEVKKRISEKNKGRKLSPESIKNISEGHKGFKMPNERKLHLQKIMPHCKKVLCVETGEIFISLKSAARKYNLDVSVLSKLCRGVRNHKLGGYHWRYANE